MTAIKMKVIYGWTAALVTAGLTLGNSAWAVENLRFATTHAPQTHFNNQVMTPWAENITQEYGDVLRIQTMQGNAIANQGNVFERVLSNTVQIGWGVHSVASGQFPRSGVTYLPGIVEPHELPHASEMASVALWRLYESGALDAEYQDIVPLALMAFPQYDLHLRSEAAGLDDLRGTRLQIGSRLHAALAEQLGAVPMTVSSADTYQALSRGTIDGSFNVWSAFAPFRLEEVTRYHVGLGAGAPTGLIFMRRDVFDALSPRAQEAILAESGEKLSRQLGEVFDKVSQSTSERLLASERHHAVDLNQHQRERLNTIYAELRQQWIDETPNGQGLYDQYRQIIADIRQEF